MTTTYLTVAIPYVNAEPHLGYAYELVLADIHARACRLDGANVRFLGGTDDYSLKNVIAAKTRAFRFASSSTAMPGASKTSVLRSISASTTSFERAPIVDMFLPFIISGTQS